MKVVVVKSPKVISGLMRLIFKIKKEEEQDNWRYSCDPPPVYLTGGGSIAQRYRPIFLFRGLFHFHLQGSLSICPVFQHTVSCGMLRHFYAGYSIPQGLLGRSYCDCGLGQRTLGVLRTIRHTLQLHHNSQGTPFRCHGIRHSYTAVQV